MRFPTISGRRGIVAAIVLLIGFAWADLAARVQAAPADGLAQTEVGQEQLRSTTSRVAGQLDAILDEFQRNGLTGDDVQLLGAIRAILGQLGEQDMVHVVALLQEARAASEGGQRRPRLLEAFSTQKGVSMKLRQILLEYQKQQELAGVAARLEELANRQQVAMRDTHGLAVAAGGRKREWLTENQRISLQLQLSEQRSLHDEVVAVLQRLAQWKGDQDNDAAARAAQALEQPGVRRLGRVLEGTVTDLEDGQLLSAVGRQRETRGLLRDLARLLIPPADEMEALQNALRQTEALTARQLDVQTVTRQLPERSPSVEQAVRDQSHLVDDGDLVRHDVADLDTAAAEQLASAVGRMQEARGMMESRSPDLRARRLAATTQQELVLARLEAARRLLQERIDSLEKQRAAAMDPLSNLKQVRADVAELLERQKALQSTAAELEPDPAKLRPLAPQQGDLGDRAGDVAERAALDSTEVAGQLAEAASQMRRSQRSLGEGANNRGAQQAAVDALSKALAALDEQLKALAEAEKELAELEDLLQRLIALIEAQQSLNGETTRLARQASARPAADLERDQETLAGQTRELEGDVPPTVPQAATYLGDAATQMTLARGELGANRPADARPAQDEALQNLLRARRELESRIDQLKEMLGMPPEGASLEQLAALIKAAQQDVNSALSSEALEKMARDLQKAGNRIRPATSGRMGRLPRMVQDPLQRAGDALSEASAAADGGDEPGAEGEAGRAQEALAAAAAALDLAMAGMGQQQGGGQGQAGEGNSMGQGQGRGRGRVPGSQSGKGTGDAGNFFGSGGADGPRRTTTGSGRFIGLPPRERAALLQSQGERYPQEYAPAIEQYLKNLSDQAGEPPQ